MAIDSLARRQSALLDMMLYPAGAIDQTARRSLLGQYGFLPDWYSTWTPYWAALETPAYEADLVTPQYTATLETPV